MGTELAKKEIERAQGCQLVDHIFGSVALFNTDFVTQKTIDIMMDCLSNGGFESEGHGLLSVIFRIDGHPWGKDGYNSWMFYPDSKAAVCNIEHCISMAIEDSQDPEKELSECINLYALVWKNIIQGFSHEAHHANAFVQDLEVLLTSEPAREAEEDAASEYARQMMFTLAKVRDLEPEFTESIVNMISVRLEEELSSIANLKNASPALVRWAELQTYMRDNGGTFYNPAELGKDQSTVYLKTFKEFLHFCSGDDESDEEWATPTIGVGCTMTQEPLMETATGTPAQPTPETIASFQIAEAYEADSVNEMLEFADNVAPFDADEGPLTGVPGLQGVATAYKAYTPPIEQPATGYTQQPTVGYQSAGYGQAVQPTYGTGAVVMGAGAYPAITLPASINAQAVINGLYLKIFKQVFIGCQYNPTNPNMPFAAITNITQPIQLDQNESMFVKEMECLNQQGQRCSGIKVNGVIAGYYVDKAGLLPGFDLTMSNMEGTQIKRRFIPQNPSKMVNGAYTNTAVDAQRGNQILWIIDPDAKGKNSYSIRVYNGQIQTNNNGKWEGIRQG